nr:sigma-54-dependent Fis family transcriptional regulator [Candidatus Dependentiae bacterium]
IILKNISGLYSATYASIYLINQKNKLNYFKGLNAGIINIKKNVIFKMFIKKKPELTDYSEIFEKNEIDLTIKKNLTPFHLLVAPMFIKEKNIGVIILYKKHEFTLQQFLSIQIINSFLSQYFFYNKPVLENQNYYENDYSEEIIHKSPAMSKIIQIAKKAAATDSTILITGESGTGKEVLAKFIHTNSLRKRNRFVPVSCITIAHGLIESELFGSKKGAFTGAVSDKKGKFMIADSGTLFLDEISEITTDVQVKLLRVIQEKTISPLGDEKDYPVDVRIIAATNKNLEILIESNLFREDLYFRLNVVNITLPPLRERKEDIPDLIHYFEKQYNLMFGKQTEFSQSAIEKISNNYWRGNIRELENFVERTILLADSNKIKHTDFNLTTKSVSRAVKDFSNKNMTLSEAEKIFKKNFLFSKLESNRWNVTSTAKQLDIQRTYLSRLIKEFSLKTER